MDGRATTYRPHIDGLRAVAVLSVILYHIDERLLPGGFIGVDIFFAISGFLITLHILQELRDGRFSLLEFYRRRVKRIAPAMFVVVTATLVVAQFILMPEQAAGVASSTVWSLASLANVYFWRHLDTSYFAQSSSELPLLHLWSLGVEEQFYLLWPLLLLMFFRARHFVLGAVLVAVGSVVLAQWLYHTAPAFVFYMLPTRAGELLAGALLANTVVRGQHERVSRSAAAAFGLVGAVAIGLSLALISEKQVFPGFLAVPPVLGTVALILAGERGNSVVPRLLSWKPLAWVGLVSYSAYLWHWPLLAFYRYGHPTISIAVGTTIFVLTFLLAWLSYRFIEQPARRTEAGWQRVFIRQYALPAAVIGAIAVGALALQGYGVRYFSDYKHELAAARVERYPAYRFNYVCQRQRLTPKDITSPDCVVGESSNEGPVAVLWGDSTAAHYVGMVGAFARSGGYRVRNVEHSACPPIDGDPEPFVDADIVSDCRASLAMARPLIEQFDNVIISSTWDSYKDAEALMPRLFDTVKRLTARGKHVVLIGKVPEIENYDPLCREKALAYPLLRCRNATATPSPEVVQLNQQLRTFAQSTANVSFYDVTDVLCPGGVCASLASTGAPIYYDRLHLTLRASWALGERVLHEQGLPAAFRLPSP